MKDRIKGHWVSNFVPDEPDSHSKIKNIAANTAKMLVILLITVLFTELLRFFDIGKQSLILVYMLSVLIISFTTPTYVYGILSAILSTFAYDYFITDPRLAFSFFSGLPITLFTMLLATILTSGLAVQVKKQATLALDREHRAELLYEINQKLLATRDVDGITALAGEYLVSRLHRPAALFTRDPRLLSGEGSIQPEGPEAADPIFQSDEVKKRLHRVFTRGAEECREPFDDTIQLIHYEPVVSKDKILGVIVIRHDGHPLSAGNRSFVQMLAGQVALALELQYLSDEKSNIQLETEREKMRSTLLRSISHDLRTPLTSILGASSTILDEGDLDQETSAALARDIRDNAQWLIRMVENILIITRISRDMKVDKMPEAAEEVVENAVSIIRKRYPDCYVHVHIPDELLIVPMDATLIAQVLINLLDNAVKNSPEGSLIILDLNRKGNWAVFDIHDNGIGIPESLLDNLFEIPPNDEGGTAQVQVVDSNRGMGIGLNICKTIIHAHCGSIEGHNSKKGGATFSFRLPIQEESHVR